MTTLQTALLALSIIISTAHGCSYDASVHCGCVAAQWKWQQQGGGMNSIKVYWCDAGYTKEGTVCKKICPPPTPKPTDRPTIAPATVCGLQGYQTNFWIDIEQGNFEYSRCKTTMNSCDVDEEAWYIEGCGCGCKPKCIPFGSALLYPPGFVSSENADAVYEGNVCGIHYWCAEGPAAGWSIEGCGCGCETAYTGAENKWCEENINAQGDAWSCPPSQHVIAMGKGQTNPAPECVSDTATTGSVGTSIVVRCCRADGNKGKSKYFNAGCFGNAASYSAAKSICEDNHGYDFEMRLCTRQEIKDELTRGTGCGYDNRYVWTSDACHPLGYGYDAALKADKIAHDGDALDTHDDNNKFNGNGSVINIAIVSVAVLFVLALSVGALFCYRRRHSNTNAKEAENEKEIEEKDVVPELVKDASVTNTTQMEMA